MSKVYALIKPRTEAVAYLRELLTGHGMEWLGEETVNQGYGMKISGEDQVAAFSGVLYFDKKGFSSRLVMNKGSEGLFQLLEENLAHPGAQNAAEADRAAITPATDKTMADEPVILEQLASRAHIGTDESGKGDYFGPLVVAGVFIQPQDVAVLREMGVADSKTLAAKKIKSLAESLRELLQGRFNVVYIGPEKYNELYAKMGNLNKMLAWAHARVMENLLERLEMLEKSGRLDCQYALTDKFGHESLIQRALMQKGRQIRLVQIPRGERDPAVAAASVIARDVFVHKMDELAQKYGIVLPKGCNEQVRKTAQQFVAKYGQDELGKVAKLHFKTTQELRQN
ncbi:MAG TPA: ribonuclease HIII [Peptococcaceae bacterium]|jgi:ribonuclease HIII|nr:ribonuclease HIII [Peptococcaceae bacterium]